eukprot:COSAG05_NODE_6829_length_895_cov_1.277638_1_plen_141_part_00
MHGCCIGSVVCAAAIEDAAENAADSGKSLALRDGPDFDAARPETFATAPGTLAVDGGCCCCGFCSADSTRLNVAVAASICRIDPRSTVLGSYSMLASILLSAFMLFCNIETLIAVMTPLQIRVNGSAVRACNINIYARSA